jgi:hypothetical protein
MGDLTMNEHSAVAVAVLGLLSKIFEFGKQKQKEPVVVPVTVPSATPVPYDKDAALMCLAFVAIVAIVAIFAFAASRQSA